MFAFRLCLALGYPHPDALLSRMSARQLAEWKVFYSLDPFGEQRADMRNALLGSVVSGSMTGKAIPIHDLMLYDEEGKRRAEEAKQRANVSKMRAWFDGKAKEGDTKH